MQGSYVLPLFANEVTDQTELSAYLSRLARSHEVIVVDGSRDEVWDAHDRAWGDVVSVHCRPDPDLAYRNGKVNGVITGLRRASHEHVVIADDDIRYEDDQLDVVLALLWVAEVVRPQNYFDPAPWHAQWDTARTLINRAIGRDYPGTLGVCRSVLLRRGGYDGDVMFENLELIRTVLAGGGRELAPLDLFVRRLPPASRQFWSQRVRHAYDDFARPVHLIAALSVLPTLALAIALGNWTAVAATLIAPVALAAAGRIRGRGRAVFSAEAIAFAPLWTLERAVCSWLAVAERVRFGGVRYRGGVVPVAAHSLGELRRQY